MYDHCMNRAEFVEAMFGTGHAHLAVHTITPRPGVAQPQCPSCDGPIASMEITSRGEGLDVECVCVNGHEWDAPETHVNFVS